MKPYEVVFKDKGADFGRSDCAFDLLEDAVRYGYTIMRGLDSVEAFRIVEWVQGEGWKIHFEKWATIHISDVLPKTAANIAVARLPFDSYNNAIVNAARWLCEQGKAHYEYLGTNTHTAWKYGDDVIDI